MENKVYYGEYSLRHWIDLVLKRNIILPDYQRLFVWDERKVKTLIDTFNKKQFVPPVTIGAFNENGTNKNLILDGQQRITSIILSYLGIFPDKKIFKNKIKNFSNENDDSFEELGFDNILRWNINKLVKKGNNKNKILSKLEKNNYKNINFEIDDDFLNTNFLGFAYLVPQSTNHNEQQKYYSSVFRNINIQGEALLAQESRASLYYLEKELKELFTPKFCEEITIKILNNTSQIDFVRYLSLLSQYKKDNIIQNVAKGYRTKMEKLYEEFIYSAIGEEGYDKFENFLDIFPEKQYKADLESLKVSVNNLDIIGEYPSIIDVDVYLFGLIYQVIFEKNSLDFSKSSKLKEELSKKVDEFKSNLSHQKTPNNLSYLRDRISQSIEIYQKYVTYES